MVDYSDLPLTVAHWGVYRAEAENGSLKHLHPFEQDANPSPIAQGYRDSLDGEMRIKYPMVRKGWLENGPISGTDRRGHDPFVQVDWDTAEKLVAAELNRVRTEYGNGSIYGGSYGWSGAGRFHHAQSQLHRFLNCIGGYTASKDSYSLAAGEVILKHIIGDAFSFIHHAQPWSSVAADTDLLVAFGGMALRNAQINNGGAGQHQSRDALLQAKSAGVEFVNISPIRSDVLDELDAQWIAPRPNSDVAIMLGLAHEIIRHGWQDDAFLDRYTYGFAEFIAYVTGEKDGVAKTVDWAADISGVSAEVIAKLAARMVQGRTLISVSWSLTRQEFGEQPFWMATTLAAMIGQIGLSGGGIAYGYCTANSVGSDRPTVSYASLPQFENPVRDFIPVARIADMLLKAGQEYIYNGQRRIYPDTKLIYWAGGNPFHHHQDLTKLVAAWQKPETIIVHEWCWNATAKRADIVLPCTTPLERADMMITPRDRYIVAMDQIVAPIGESKSDYDIFCGLADRLGVGQKFSNNWNPQQWIDWIYVESQRKAKEFGVELPNHEEFLQKRWHKVTTPAQSRDAFSNFRENPDQAPLLTPSGKIEILSQAIAHFDRDDICPYPNWQEPKEWLGAGNTDYPFHLMMSQPADKLHAQLDQGEYSRAQKISGRTPIDINSKDAKRLGISQGMVVRVYNDRGACLAAANLTKNVMQGVFRMSTGAWLDAMTQADGSLLCRHGNPNTVTRDIGTSELAQGPSAHSCLVAIEPFPDAPEVMAFQPPEIQYL